MSTLWPVINRIILAEHLRRYASLSKSRNKKEKEDSLIDQRTVLEQKKKLFIQSEYLEQEFEELELRILDAAKQGIFEVLVMSFDSSFCTDGGRAINNNEPGWPETLQGKARGFYEIWSKFGRPKGYHVKAIIRNFPGGLPGDVGIFLDWC